MILTRSKSLLQWLLLGSLIFIIFAAFSPTPSPLPLTLKDLKQRFIGGRKNGCDLFDGGWVRDAGGGGPAYTNETCKWLPESKKCGKYGKKGGYVGWRWQPKGCELPRFIASEFFDIVRGKKLAFIGDSVARNQADSLVCLLSQVRQVATRCPIW